MSEPTTTPTEALEISARLRALQNGWEKPLDVILLAQRAADLIDKLRWKQERVELPLPPAVAGRFAHVEVTDD